MKCNGLNGCKPFMIYKVFKAMLKCCQYIQMMWIFLLENSLSKHLKWIHFKWARPDNESCFFFPPLNLPDHQMLSCDCCLATLNISRYKSSIAFFFSLSLLLSALPCDLYYSGLHLLIQNKIKNIINYCMDMLHWRYRIRKGYSLA